MKLICIGRNYRDHAKELNNPIPKQPLIFMKPSSAICQSSKVPYPPFTSNLHYELEVLLFISKSGSNISIDDAPDYFEEVGLGIDFTARDIQARCKEKGHPWERAKAFDNSAIISTRISKSTLDVNQIEFTLKKNGETVQLGNTKDLIFDFNYLIHNVSQQFTLEEGDVIFTGTPAGVGSVQIGDKLTGFLQDDLFLNLSIF